MGLLDRALKRQCFQVPDEPDLFVKGWSFIDLDTSNSIDTDEKNKDAAANKERQNWFLLGCALVESDGTPVFKRGEDEEPIAFADRVKAALLKIGFDVGAFKRSFEAIQKVGSVDLTDLKKSSPTTPTPASPAESDSNASACGTGGT